MHINKEIGNDDGGGNRIPGCMISILDIEYLVYDLW
jgi:hypothetical protein